MSVIVLVNVDDLSGKNVIGTGGSLIGEVKGAEVNTNTWQITHLRVKLSGTASDQMGLKKRFGSSTVCMPVSLISAIGDVVTIKKSLDEISNTPDVSECPE